MHDLPGRAEERRHHQATFLRPSLPLVVYRGVAASEVSLSGLPRPVGQQLIIVMPWKLYNNHSTMTEVFIAALSTARFEMNDEDQEYYRDEKAKEIQEVRVALEQLH